MPDQESEVLEVHWCAPPGDGQDRQMQRMTSCRRRQRPVWESRVQAPALTLTTLPGGLRSLGIPSGERIPYLGKDPLSYLE